MSGYAAIGLDHPKCLANLGGVMRAAKCYGAACVIIGGGRFQRSITDTTKAYRSIPTLALEDVLLGIPFDCVPVAVDLVDGAIPLPEYKHPKRAFYIFGPEDGTLGSRILAKCRDKIMVPTLHCMNLAATANVILYDRVAKAALTPITKPEQEGVK